MDHATPLESPKSRPRPGAPARQRLRIEKISTFLADLGGRKNLLFVKVDTDQGWHGWGECYTQSDRDRAVIAHVEALGRYLVGRDASHITHLLHMAYNDFAAKRGSMDFWCAVSGIEHALWDIAGKRLDVPVHELLGGRCRDRIRVYANGWYGPWYGTGKARTPEEFAQRARDTVALGFTALKFDPFQGPWRTHVSAQAEREAVERVAAVREAVGPDVALLMELHRRLAPMHATRFARAIAPFDPFWYEEPVASSNLDALAEVRRETTLPIVTGEDLCTRAEMRRAIELRAADILNPDICICGGILELRAIAQMAEPSYMTISPHNYNSTTIGLAATIQVSAAIPNFLITEYFVDFAERGDAIARPAFDVVDGHIRVPESPGLGMDLDEAALAGFPGREFPMRSLPTPADEL